MKNRFLASMDTQRDILQWFSCNMGRDVSKIDPYGQILYGPLSRILSIHKISTNIKLNLITHNNYCRL